MDATTDQFVVVDASDGGCGDTQTDNNNCGKCGNVRNTTDNCFDGMCGGDTLVDVGAGSDSACVVTKSGAVFCWGGNLYHQLGADSGTTTCSTGQPCSPQALRVVGVSDAIHVDVGDGAACVIRATGSVSCWGINNKSQLGHANGDDTCNGMPCNQTPTDVVGLPGGDPVSQIVVGGQSDRATEHVLVQRAEPSCVGVITQTGHWVTPH